MYRICSIVGILSGMCNFYSNKRCLCGCQLFLGGAYFTDIATCDTVNRVLLSSCYTSCLDVTFIWVLTYCLSVFLELETINAMATVPATHQLMAIEELNFQRTMKSETTTVIFATDTVTATI